MGADATEADTEMAAIVEEENTAKAHKHQLCLAVLAVNTP